MNPLDRFVLALTSVTAAPHTPNKDAEVSRLLDRLLTPTTPERS